MNPNLRTIVNAVQAICIAACAAAFAHASDTVPVGGEARDATYCSQALYEAVEALDRVIPDVVSPHVAWTDLLIDRPDVAHTDATPAREAVNRWLERGMVLDCAERDLLAAFAAAKYQLLTQRAALEPFPFLLVPEAIADAPAWTLERSTVLASSYATCDPAAAFSILLPWLAAPAADGALPARVDATSRGAAEAVEEYLARACLRAGEIGAGTNVLACMRDVLIRWDDWLWSNADSNRNGLLERGGVESVRLAAAAYDRLLVLAELAEILALPEESERCRVQAEALRARALAALYDSDRAWFFDRGLDGTLDSTVSADGLAALAAGLPPADEARRMMERHVLHPEAFWTAAPVPRVSLREVAVRDAEARSVEARNVWLAARGLERYGQWLEAAALRRRWIAAVSGAGLVRLDGATGTRTSWGTDLVAAAVFLDACARTLGCRVSTDGVVWTASSPPAAPWLRWRQPWGDETYQLYARADRQDAELTVGEHVLGRVPFGVRLITTRTGGPLALIGLAPGRRAVELPGTPAAEIGGNEILAYDGRNWERTSNAPVLLRGALE